MLSKYFCNAQYFYVALCFMDWPKIGRDLLRLLLAV